MVEDRSWPDTRHWRKGEDNGCGSEACCADDDQPEPSPTGGPADLDPGPDQTILEEAQGLTRGARQAQYGHPMSDFQAMGRITAAILGRWLESEGYTLWKQEPLGPQPQHVDGDSKRSPVYFPDIPPRIATMLMQSVKLSRGAARPSHDNRVDGAGYWDCTDMAVEAERDGPRTGSNISEVL